MLAYANERTLPQHTAQLESELALLAELIGLLQMHRGASLAALGGAAGFQQKVEELQPTIDQLIARLSYGSSQADPALWQLIQSEWRNTRKHWRKDNPLNNFEIHSFLIENCHRMLWHQLKPRVASCAHTWALLKELAEHTECIAQLRGLVSYGMTNHNNPSSTIDVQDRIVQLNRQSQCGLIDTQQKLIKLSSQQSTPIPALRARIQLTGQFLQAVQAYINTRQGPPADTTFHLGTLAIEANQRVWQILLSIEH
ncbi:hypothetical protein [Simiduia aestuariiviva]|uniref:O6-methylguanine-DNA--protein-cysteine methyltransferase n=1 Tax=Simiduia aestuariiviva TaxID=1510459 RepID=A0A839UPJ4_9GAMM|nr:hypothetical protein [Simiduia aestuariiviva]MBB3167706.1 O6-methylguanine-DNA--protein-cysteine methyltransferase [Simiduia aestuariiviva]